MQTTATSNLTVINDTTSRKPSPTLDKDGFLKLMVEQLKHQDPSAPSDSSAMLQQMSQLTSMEQMTNMATSMTAQTKQASFARAEALIGRSVTYLDDHNAAVSGTVDKVSLAGDTATLTIGGVPGIDPSALTEVR
jgi:flagellar basal-body rod modification protein FlgD